MFRKIKLMACCPTEEKYGYEDGRFEKDVDENFHCSICHNVLKEPRMCRNNEHVFCRACISEHLNVNSQTCPECKEHLSVDTLRRPRVVNNYLSKLKINCDYASRGCPEFTCIEDLENHVAHCGFAPVLCSNGNCGMVVNRQDRNHHESEVCEYRNVKCQDCTQIKEDVGTLKAGLMELEGKVEAVERKIENNHIELKIIVGKLEGSLVGMNKRINEKVEALKKSHEEMKQDQREVKNERKDMKENLLKVNQDVDEVKVMMSQMLEKLNMLELLNKLPSPTKRMLNTPREDILIAGGGSSALSTEVFSWEKLGWFKVCPMNQPHSGASSFIYNDQLFVVGGDFSKTIETLDLNELPLKWMKFPAEPPYTSVDDCTVLYQQRVIHVGRYYDEECEQFNVINELQLTSPCTTRELCQMPGPRDCHGAETFEDKVLIVGGEDGNNDVLDSVLEFDPKKNTCKEMPPLPYPLTKMATVRWTDQVIALGGYDKDGHYLNDVFMYDCKTGKATTLPSMLERRSSCCAVITGNTIVVMGGDNENDGYLNSVECFTMGGSFWEYLHAMNDARFNAVAEVLPSTKKYV